MYKLENRQSKNGRECITLMMTYTLCFYREGNVVMRETEWEREGNPKKDSVNKQYRKEKIKKRQNLRDLS